MSELIEMPLFPLNSVLFPGMPLHLHIFEPRYKTMINQCVQESRPFGVVLIRAGLEVGGGAETFQVGTTARITHIQRLDDGEMNIATVGQKRFKIQQTHLRNPYLTGYVEEYPLDMVPDPCIPQITRQLGPMIKSYLSIFAKLGNVEFQLEKLPDDPLTLAFLTAVVLNVPARDKQRLLDIPDLVTLLRAERHMLAREARFLQHLVENGPRWRDDPGLFSPN